MSTYTFDHPAKNVIARGVAERIVRRLEVIYVDEGKDEGFVCSLRPSRRALQLRHSHVPALRPSELIYRRRRPLPCRQAAVC